MAPISMVGSHGQLYCGIFLRVFQVAWINPNPTMEIHGEMVMTKTFEGRVFQVRAQLPNQIKDKSRLLKLDLDVWIC